ncbi:SRPBCC family protein [Jatrophihabitans fulvus]
MARTHQESIDIAVGPEAVYDLVSDITRTGEWSPICRRCEWDEGATGRVGDGFTGHNEDAGREWSTHSTVVAADRGRRFGWQVADGLVEWNYLLEPTDGGTRLTETWEFRDAGLAMFRERYGDEADAQIEQRTRAAHAGIPATLAALKRIAEAG